MAPAPDDAPEHDLEDELRTLRQALEGGGASQRALAEALAPFDGATASALAAAEAPKPAEPGSALSWAPWAAAGALAFGAGLALTTYMLQRDGGVPYQEGTLADESPGPEASPASGASPAVPAAAASPQLAGGRGTPPATSPAPSAAPSPAPPAKPSPAPAAMASSLTSPPGAAAPSAAPAATASSAAPGAASPAPVATPSPPAGRATPAPHAPAPAGAAEPPSAGPPAAEAPAPHRPAGAAAHAVRVRAGDTLWAIAWRETGSPLAWSAIAEANVLAHPDRLRVGQVLRVPATLHPKAVTRAHAGRAASRYIRVRPGDSLWSIAAREYGDPYVWVLLYRANRGRLHGPDHLPAGLWLRRPPLS